MYGLGTDVCHGKFQTSLRIIRWSKFALNLLSYPFLNCSTLSQIKKVDEELNCFYSGLEQNQRVNLMNGDSFVKFLFKMASQRGVECLDDLRVWLSSRLESYLSIE